MVFVRRACAPTGGVKLCEFAGAFAKSGISAGAAAVEMLLLLNLLLMRIKLLLMQVVLLLLGCCGQLPCSLQLPSP